MKSLSNMSIIVNNNMHARIHEYLYYLLCFCCWGICRGAALASRSARLSFWTTTYDNALLIAEPLWQHGLVHIATEDTEPAISGRLFC